MRLAHSHRGVWGLSTTIASCSCEMFLISHARVCILLISGYPCFLLDFCLLLLVQLSFAFAAPSPSHMRVIAHASPHARCKWPALPGGTRTAARKTALRADPRQVTASLLIADAPNHHRKLYPKPIPHLCDPCRGCVKAPVHLIPPRPAPALIWVTEEIARPALHRATARPTSLFLPRRRRQLPTSRPATSQLPLSYHIRTLATTSPPRSFCFNNTFHDSFHDLRPTLRTLL